jgi:rubrerythrin
MPAKSEKQRRLFGAALGMKRGNAPKSGDAGKIAGDMSEEKIEDFAKKSLMKSIDSIIWKADRDELIEQLKAEIAEEKKGAKHYAMLADLADKLGNDDVEEALRLMAYQESKHAMMLDRSIKKLRKGPISR